MGRKVSNHDQIGLGDKPIRFENFVMVSSLFVAQKVEVGSEQQSCHQTPKVKGLVGNETSILNGSAYFNFNKHCCE